MLNPTEWLEAERKLLYEGYNDDNLNGFWPDGIEPYNHFGALYDFETTEFCPEIFIGLVPTQQSWNVPAYLT